MQTNKTFVLVAIKGNHHQPVKEGVVKIVQSERTRLKASGNWRGWAFQVRTKEGYKNVPILTKSIKTKN